MNYKETLFFVAKSLTISLEEKNKAEIELILKTTNVDWNAVVKVSTSHYVFPAIYCNFKRANFLKYLPFDLVDYMKHIATLNRDRNIQILHQAQELNTLLLANNITPIFLKGTGNLLAEIYEDVAERMVGDIDFLFSEKDYLKAIEIIKNDNYTKTEGQLDYFPGSKHYSRLVKKENIAAIEIHNEVTLENYRGEFNFQIISQDTKLINGFSILSFENQLSLSIISSQINDYGFDLMNFSLRNAYDVLLFSKKTDTKKAISNFVKLKNPLNCFIANCNLVFGGLGSLDYYKTKQSENYLRSFNKSLYKRNYNQKINFKLSIINFKRRFGKVCKSIFNSENRKWLLNRIKNKLNL